MSDLFDQLQAELADRYTIEGEIGFLYRWKERFHLQGGLRVARWEDATTRAHVIDPGQQNQTTPSSQTGSVTFQGPYLGVGFKF